jgi:membrane-associated phospholipid phosphatase
MKRLIAKHLNHWSDSSLVVSTLTGVLFFLISLVVNYAASTFANDRAGSNVPDLIISNIPVFNVDFIVNELALCFFFFMLIIVLLDPKTMPFAFKSAALFIIIRSVFIILTHLGPFPERSFIDRSEFFGPFNLGSDFFFSGHTGLPFLMALIFWEENKFVRWISLAASILFGVSVLLGHLHYSIDVFAAFFITYTIFHLSQKFFAQDYRLFSKKNPEMPK